VSSVTKSSTLDARVDVEHHISDMTYIPNYLRFSVM